MYRVRLIAALVQFISASSAFIVGFGIRKLIAFLLWVVTQDNIPHTPSLTFLIRYGYTDVLQSLQ
jgi:hypothetical protein